MLIEKKKDNRSKYLGLFLSTSFYDWNYLRHIVSLGEMITLAILLVLIKSLHLTWGKKQ